MIKIILVLLFLVAIGFAQSPELVKCIEQQCPDQYKKCKSTSGCEKKLNSCAAKCGEKLNQSCWTLCLGLPGAAANVCLCAVNKGCIKNMTVLDRISLQAMNILDNANLRSQWSYPDIILPININHSRSFKKSALALPIVDLPSPVIRSRNNDATGPRQNTEEIGHVCLNSLIHIIMIVRYSTNHIFEWLHFCLSIFS